MSSLMNYPGRKLNAAGQRQSGSALFVALVLIIVSTLIGISALESSGVEVQLANNDLYREVSFRAAETSSGRLLTDANVVGLASGNNTSITSNFSIDDKIAVEANLENNGTGIARGFSLGVDTNGFQMYKFTSSATATIEGVNTQRVVIQGSERLAPSL